MLPDFLRQPDAGYRGHREWARDAYAQRGDQDRRLLLNEGWGEMPFTVEDALFWAERLAAEELA